MSDVVKHIETNRLDETHANYDIRRFHDHQMITSHKDVLGTELLSVPFRKEDLEAVLEDLMS